MRVALIGPDLEENLSIRYLSAALQEAGHTPRIIAFDTDADFENVRAACERADLVALSLCYQIRAREFIDLAKALRADRPERPIIVGGHYASCAAGELLAFHPVFDVIVIHEGERTIVELASLDAISPETLTDVRGIAFRDTDGMVKHTAPRPIVADLDTLPWADRSGPARLVVGVPTAYMMGSRGCVSNCDYCAITTLHRLAPGRRFRQRAPEKIADEMASLYHGRGVRQFVFHDDNFLVPKVSHNLQRIDALATALEERGVESIGLVLKCRPADVDAEVFERLKALGLLRVFLGIESASAAGLASLGRRQQTVAQEHRALDVCAELGISTQYTIITFHPEATPQTMRDDLDFARRHIQHPLSFCRAEAYRGTPLEQRMLDAGRARGDYLARSYSYSDDVVPVIWQAGVELLRDRCWSQQNLLGQAIQLDHLAAVYRHFYVGPDVDALVAEMRAFQYDVNSDSVELIARLIDACEANPSLESEALSRELAELHQHERATTHVLQQRACELREALRTQSYRKLGLEPSKPITRRSASLLSRIPRHAAALVLALGIASCNGDGTKQDSGVIEAPPPPMDMRVDVKQDLGVIEAPPPPMDLSVDVREDFGVIEAPPPPMDAGPKDGAQGN